MDHKPSALVLVVFVLVLWLTTLTDGATTISPLPSQYWVSGIYHSQNSSSLYQLVISPMLRCYPASNWNPSYLAGSSNESRYAIYRNGSLDIIFCNSTNCTNCNSFATLPLNQYMANFTGYTMFLVNQLPPIQPGSTVYVQQSAHTCPAGSNSTYIHSIIVNSPSCRRTSDGTIVGSFCNGTGQVTVSQCRDDQCLQGCNVDTYTPFDTCRYSYCVGALSIIATPNDTPKSILSATSNSSKFVHLPTLLLLLLKTMAIVM